MNMHLLLAEKVMQRLTIHNIQQSKQITGTQHQNLESSEPYFSWERLPGWWSSMFFIFNNSV